MLCLIAFAVVAAFDDSFEFQKNCGNDTVVNMTKRTFHFGYPFELVIVLVISIIIMEWYINQAN